MIRIDRNGEAWREGWLCQKCFVIWTEEQVYDYFDDNEDNSLLALSMDQCPRCTFELYDYDFGG